MKLFFRKLGQGQPLIILHGLFGASDNWLSIAKVLAENYEVFILDQRNHGQSPHSDIFDYPTLADDLKEFIEDQSIDNPIIVGHSMGGKVAMEYAVQHPDSFEKLIVVDIAPKKYPVHHDAILDGLNSLDLGAIKSRGEADKQLANYITEIGVRQFLLKNLGRDSDGFSWKINLPVLTRNIEIIGSGLSKPYLGDSAVLFIRGQNSNYIKDEDFSLIKEFFDGAQIQTVKDAGHWVHAEKPAEFMNTLTNFLTTL